MVVKNKDNIKISIEKTDDGLFIGKIKKSKINTNSIFVLTQLGNLKSKLFFNSIEDVFSFIKNDFVPFNDKWRVVKINSFKSKAVSSVYTTTVDYFNEISENYHSVNYEIIQMNQYL